MRFILFLCWYSFFFNTPGSTFELLLKNYVIKILNFLGCLEIYNATKDFIQLRLFKVNQNKDKNYVDNGVEIKKVTLTCEEKVMPTEIHSSWVTKDKQVRIIIAAL